MAVNLKWPDYLIFVLFLIISLGIGIYHALTGGRQRTTEEFIMANRKLKVIPTALSLMVSFQSATGTLGITAETYLYGTQFSLLSAMSIILGIIISERIIVPWLYPLKLVSINDYLEMRFHSTAVRMFGAILACLTGIVYMGVAMFAPSIALLAATGFPVILSIPLMGGVAIAYTALGGMRAVIWTDVFQFFIMIGGTLAMMIKGLMMVGGTKEALRIAENEGRLDWIDWSPDPTVRQTFWSFFFGFSIQWTAIYGVYQASCQRYSSLATLAQARRAMLLNIPGIILLYVMMCYLGIAVFAYYAYIQCDVILNRDVKNPNQILSHFVTQIFVTNPGFAGLFLATLYGGSLSSISSLLSGTAAVFWEDILKHTRLIHWPEAKKTMMNRILVVVFGVLSAIFAFVAIFLPGPVIQITMAIGGSVYGPLLGVFLLGGLSKRGNWKGAMIGGCVSLVVFGVINAGSFSVQHKLPKLPPVSIAGCPSKLNNTIIHLTNATSYYMNSFKPPTPPRIVTPLTGFERLLSISYLYYVTFSAILSLVLGLIFSHIFRDIEAESQVEERLLIPFKQALSCTGIFTCSDKQKNTNSIDRLDENENETALEEKFALEALLNGPVVLADLKESFI